MDKGEEKAMAVGFFREGGTSQSDDVFGLLTLFRLCIFIVF